MIHNTWYRLFEVIRYKNPFGTASVDQFRLRIFEHLPVIFNVYFYSLENAIKFTKSDQQILEILENFLEKI